MIHQATINGSIGFHKFSIPQFEGKHIFDIAIVGDCSASVVKEFTYDEITAFVSIFNMMQPDGKYVPSLFITDKTEEKRVLAEMNRKAEDERQKFMGVPSNGYNSIAAALIAAGWTMEE